MEAIKSATYHAAKVLDRLNEIGTLSPGKRADIIAEDTDPLQDVTALQKVTFVMKDGVVCKGTSDSHVP
jgi:imidazolonepropionase-like amidohydrolase